MESGQEAHTLEWKDLPVDMQDLALQKLPLSALPRLRCTCKQFDAAYQTQFFTKRRAGREAVADKGVAAYGQPFIDSAAREIRRAISGDPMTSK
jgi:hypothetical protein